MICSCAMRPRSEARKRVHLSGSLSNLALAYQNHLLAGLTLTLRILLDRPIDRGKSYRVIFGRQHGYTLRQDGNAIEGSIRIPDHPAGGVPSVTSSK